MKKDPKSRSPHSLQAASREGPRTRQFVLGPSSIAAHCSEWEELRVAPGLVLRSHPALDVTVAAHGDNRAILLGYALDPRNPGLDNHALLDGILAQCEDMEHAICLTDSLCGRWIAIFRIGDGHVLMTDPAGLRSVFHFCDDDGVVCASEPRAIAEIARLREDPDSRDYAASDAYRRCDGWWFGGSSSYAEVQRLLPNHCLDLNTGQASRFWPRVSLETVDCETALTEGSRLLAGIWEAAIHRFGKVALPVTAGLDSRVLLATSRKHLEDIFSFVSMHAPLSDRSADVYVPARLADKLDFSFHRLPCTEAMLAPHRQAYLDNTAVAQAERLHMIYTRYPGWPKGCRIVATGNANEITRASYEGLLSDTSPENLSLIFCGEKHPFVIRHLQPWFEEAEPVCEHYSFPLMDLFYWEQRMGCWCSQEFLEADYDHETLTPFNCREYLTLMLSVDARYRRDPKSTLFRDLAERNWPGCMSEPVNPIEGETLRAKLKDWASRKRWLIRWRNRLRTWRARG